MAQIPVFSEDVNLSQGSNYRSNIVQDTSGQQKLGESLQAAGQTINDFAVLQQAKLNQMNVADASATTLQNLTNTQNQLLQKKGVNALGKAATATSDAIPSVSEAFNTQASQMYQNTIDSLDNDTQRKQFQQWYNTTVPTMAAAVQKHQIQQADAAHQSAANSMMTASADAFKSSILNGDYNQASVAMRSGLGLVSQMSTLTGDPVEKQEQDQKNFVYNTVNQAVDQLITDQRPDDAWKTIDYYKAHLPDDLVASLKSKVQPAITKVDAQAYVDGLISDPNNKLPDGTPDVPKINSLLEDHFLNRTVTRNTGMANSNDPIVQAAIRDSQILNVPAAVIYSQWGLESDRFSSRLAKENFNLAGLTQTEPNGEDNKQPDGGNYYKQYKSIDEFAADYANFIKTNDASAMGAQSSAQYVTELKNNGYFTGDLNQYISNAQNMYNEYAPTFQGASETVTVPDEAGLAIAKSRLTQRYQDAVMAHKNQVLIASNSLSGALTSGQVTDISSLNAYVSNLSGITDTEREGLIAKGMTYFGIQRQQKAQEQADNLEQAYKDLRLGNITTKAELDANYAGKISEHDLYTFDRAFTSQYKWADPENMKALEGIVKQQNLTMVEQARIMEQLNGLAAQKGAQGQRLTVDDVVDVANRASTKIVSDPGRVFNSTTRMANIPAGAVQQADGSWTDDQGMPIKYDDSTSQWVKK